MASCRVFQVMRTHKGWIRIPREHKQVEPKPSTVVILCTTNNNTPDHNELCMVTKTRKTSKKNYYWSGSTVFPGGLLNAAADGQFVDFVEKYYSLWCKKYKFEFDDVMHRLNGLRELFEETGILLCRDKKEIDLLISNNNIIYPIKASILNDNRLNMRELTEWRYKIMRDPYQFENMFKSLNLIPDILSIVPWARIQTPWNTGKKGGDTKRWDVRFYLSLIDQKDALIATKGDIDDNGQIINALGKEIYRIDWVDINDAIGPKKIEKYKMIPHVTLMQLAEFYQIIQIENCLKNEWKKAYFEREITVLRFKAAIKTTNNDLLTIFHGDYLYHKLGDEQDVECDVNKENDPKYLQRIVKDGKTGKHKMYKVLQHNKRFYQYKTDKLHSKL